MISAIELKLTDLILAGVKTEAEAVYLMVQIRKILEGGPKDKYQLLKFKCDWALHPKLSGQMAQLVLGQFDEANTILRDDRKLSDLPESQRKEIERVFDMRLFKKELDTFIKERGLPEINSVKDGWTKFLWFFAKVIEDCPLEIWTSNIASNVQSVKIKAELANKIIDGHHLYKITWFISEVNGKTGELFVINSFSVGEDES